MQSLRMPGGIDSIHLAFSFSLWAKPPESTYQVFVWHCRLCYQGTDDCCQLLQDHDLQAKLKLGLMFLETFKSMMVPSSTLYYLIIRKTRCLWALPFFQ